MNASQKEDIRALIYFLQSTEKIIKKLVYDSGDFVLIEYARDENFKEIMLLAWEDVQVKIKETIIEIQSINKNKRKYKKLEAVGLTGNQLSFKINLFKRFLENFFTIGTTRALKQLLGCINSIIKSLSNVFIPIDVVGEFKEMLEQILKVNRRKQYP